MDREPNTKPEATANPQGRMDALVMGRSSLELIDTLATMLGIAGDESTEARWNDELYRRRVLMAAARELDRAWNGV